MKVWPQTQIETEECSHQVGLIYPPHVADWANNPSAGLNWGVIYNLEGINLTLNGFFFHIWGWIYRDGGESNDGAESDHF